MSRIMLRPRFIGLVCGIVAVVLGAGYIVAADAPARYLVVNLAALMMGSSLWVAFKPTAVARMTRDGRAIPALAVPLLLTAAFGVAVEDTSRWVSIGPLVLQLSLIVVPVMTILYARRPDVVGATGLAIAALALAAQPDRAMAGALVAGLVAVLAAKPDRFTIAALVVAVPAFGWTLVSPDTLPAMPFVDGVLHTAFHVHPAAGSAVALGAVALLVPAMFGIARIDGHRSTALAFGACWSAVLIAAAVGNYPTPLVGYGGSAILGYMLSVAVLPNGFRDAKQDGIGGSSTPATPGRDSAFSDPRVMKAT